MIAISTALMVGAVCVVFQAFFSGAEIAMVSANRTRIRQLAQGGDRSARLVEGFLARPEVLLSTTLLGTNLALLIFSVTAAIALMGRDVANSSLVAIGMVTPMTLIFGEVVPKTAFQEHADRIVTKIVYPLRVASVVFLPIVWVMGGFAALLILSAAPIVFSKHSDPFARLQRDRDAMRLSGQAGADITITDPGPELIERESTAPPPRRLVRVRLPEHAG